MRGILFLRIFRSANQHGNKKQTGNVSLYNKFSLAKSDINN